MQQCKLYSAVPLEVTHVELHCMELHSSQMHQRHSVARVAVGWLTTTAIVQHQMGGTHHQLCHQMGGTNHHHCHQMLGPSAWLDQHTNHHHNRAIYRQCAALYQKCHYQAVVVKCKKPFFV